MTFCQIKEKENRESGAFHLKYLILRKTFSATQLQAYCLANKCAHRWCFSRGIWIATASPAVHSGMAKVSVDMEEIVRTQGEAGERCSGTSPADLMPGACQRRGRREHLPVPGEKRLKVALPVLPEAEVSEKLLRAGLGWLEALLWAATAGLQQRSALERGREGGQFEPATLWYT